MPRWQHRVTIAEAGQRLDRFLEATLDGRSRSQIKRLVEAGAVTLARAPAKAGHSIREGDEIAVEIPDPVSELPEPQDIPLDVVFEDDDLLVIDKPADLVVHPGAGRPDGTLVNALLGRGTPLSPLGAPFRPGIVHRLDKGTTGLLVVAKTEAAHVDLARQLEARDMERRYWALVWGAPEEDQGRIVGMLARSRADRRRMRVVTRGGRRAATRYTVLWRGEDVSVVTLALETGRTHQIRAHFKHVGHPVVADPEYGGRGKRASGLTGARREGVLAALAALDRQALHAWRLGFVHPTTGKPVQFTSRLPGDIRKAAEALGVPESVLTMGLQEE